MKTHFANPKRIQAARLAANLSRGDLAFAIRQSTGGQIKATERGIAGWESGEYSPRDGVVPAIAAATGKDISFFYEADAGDDDEDSRAVRFRRLRANLILAGHDDLAAELTALAGLTGELAQL